MNISKMSVHCIFAYISKCANLTIIKSRFSCVKNFHVCCQIPSLNRFITFSTINIFTLLMNIFEMYGKTTLYCCLIITYLTLIAFFEMNRFDMC